MTAETESATGKLPRKPRFAYLIATAFGVGYLKPAPGTGGSLVGVALFALLSASGQHDVGLFGRYIVVNFRPVPVIVQAALLILVSMAGVLAASRVANYCGVKDPQIVVIDEVSGQWLALFLGAASVPYVVHAAPINNPVTQYVVLHFRPGLVNWKYLLLGFILFRAFDMWKPFPARQAESLPGGWGIMADDWMAALYAAAGLWIARLLGL